MYKTLKFRAPLIQDSPDKISPNCTNSKALLIKMDKKFFR
jgi:hypothetical protein